MESNVVASGRKVLRDSDENVHLSSGSRTVNVLRGQRHLQTMIRQAPVRDITGPFVNRKVNPRFRRILFSHLYFSVGDE